MSKRTSRERFTELLFYAVVFLVAYLAYQVILPFLTPLAWAAILGMTLRPWYRRFCVRLSNSNAALVTTFLASVLIIAPAVFLVSVLAQQVPVALDYIGSLSATTPEQVTRAWQVIRARVPSPLPEDPMVLVSQAAQALTTFIAGNAGSFLADVLATVGSLLVMLFALFFFLRDGRVFGEFVRRVMPFSEAESDRLISETQALVVASVGAGLVVAFIQGMIGGLSFWVLKLPAPAVWGAAIGICSLLPVVGATIVWVPVVVWLFLTGDVTRAVLLTALSGLVIGSVDNVLRPWILAGRTSASGLVVFIGLLGGAAAFGFVGLVIGPIALVIAGTLMDALTRRVVQTPDEIVVQE